MRLDRLLLARLEQRTLDAATLPVALVQQIGAVLERSAGEVALFLRGGPRLSAQAHYRSQRVPSVATAPATSFQRAVAGSRLSAEDKAYWQAQRDTVLGE